MTESPFQPREHARGHVHNDPVLTVFFGDRNSTPENLIAEFPEYTLSQLRQTHSDIVVQRPTDGSAAEADAHFTREKRVALCIRTADCMPVMIHDPDTGTIAAIHAGWRGIENEIIRKTGRRLLKDGAELGRARAWIGPHILGRSFEVGADVAQRLEAAFENVRGFSPAASPILPSTSGASSKEAKIHVDLLCIARAQLASIGIEPERTIELNVDTLSSSSHESFRRERELAGRQISFIALK